MNMKKTLFLLLLFPCLSFAQQTASQGSLISADIMNSSISQIGEIKQSILTPAQFQSLNGDCWKLMNGQSISGTDLAQLGITSAPDARGGFLRGANNGRSDGQENPENKQLGEFQTDALQGHKHRTSSAYSSADLALYGTVSPTGFTFSHADGATTAHGHLTSTPTDSDGINGTPRVGKETRVKNITVNFFIKVNKSCNFN